MFGKQWETIVYEHFRDGWRFRVKISKGKRYITRRKGQKEKGMGRFTDERWGVIERLKDEHPGPESHTQPDVGDRIEASAISDVSEQEMRSLWLSRREYLRDKIDDHIALYRGALKMAECMYVVNLYCSYWTWSGRPSFFDEVDECFGSDLYTRMDIQEGDRVEDKWVFRASPRYCSLCSLFKEK